MDSQICLEPARHNTHHQFDSLMPGRQCATGGRAAGSVPLTKGIVQMVITAVVNIAVILWDRKNRFADGRRSPPGSGEGEFVDSHGVAVFAKVWIFCTRSVTSGTACSRGFTADCDGSGIGGTAAHVQRIVQIDAETIFYVLVGCLVVTIIIKVAIRTTQNVAPMLADKRRMDEMAKYMTTASCYSQLGGRRLLPSNCFESSGTPHSFGYNSTHSAMRSLKRRWRMVCVPGESPALEMRIKHEAIRVVFHV